MHVRFHRPIIIAVHDRIKLLALLLVVGLIAHSLSKKIALRTSADRTVHAVIQ